MKTLLLLLRATVHNFKRDRGIKLSASLSFYTVLYSTPLLLIVIAFAGFFWGERMVQSSIYDQIKAVIGTGTAKQIEYTINHLRQLKQHSIGTLVSLVVIIVGSTTIFMEIQDSLNHILSIEAKPKRSWLKVLINRALSFSIILILGLVLMVVLSLNTFLDILSTRISVHFLPFSFSLIYLVDFVLVIVVITVLFAIVFKILPDAVVSWKAAFVGGCFTAVLFLIGKFLIGIFLRRSTITTTYGATASIILFMLWIYYSSMIFYLGAEFTKIYAKKIGKAIVPSRQAMFVVKREVHSF